MIFLDLFIASHKRDSPFYCLVSSIEQQQTNFFPLYVLFRNIREIRFNIIEEEGKGKNYTKPRKTARIKFFMLGGWKINTQKPFKNCD
jgi:hypothetical protein